MKKVFVSYSWEDDSHMNWVTKLAGDLEKNPDIHVVLDQYDLSSTMDKNKFMEDAIYDSEIVVVIATHGYMRKANERIGGVGIESTLNAQKFWETVDTHGTSNTLVVSREPGSTPRYLKQQFHIDFSADDAYEKNLHTLLREIRGKKMVERPAKVYKPEKRAYELTLVSKLIGLSSKKRKELVSIRNGTDYSGANKIKFEVWETNTPAPNHIIALHNNVNITQSLSRAAESILSQGSTPKYITILRDRPRSKSASYPTTQAWKNLTKNAQINDTSYTDYTWEYCIEDSFKSEPPPHSIDFYTEQDIASGEELHANAALHLASILTSTSDCSPILVRGGGGIGKTSLCTALVSHLMKHHNKHFICYLIRSEDIRRHLDGGPTPSVDGIYDLYQLQASYLGQSNILDRDTFELSVLSGNLIIVIDGLDEFPSILKDSFNPQLLLESITHLQQQLGFGRILITSRPSASGLDSAFASSGFDIMDLLGFDTNSRERYLSKRFRSSNEKESIIRKINAHIDGTPLSDDNRILPFFIDVLSCVYEEASESKPSNLKIEFSPTPYPSLNELTDHIISAIITRESNRHNNLISEGNFVEFFKEITQSHDGVLSNAELMETIQLLFDQNHDEIVELVKKNPLIRCLPDGISLKYDFLTSYFNTIFILSGTVEDFNRSYVMALSRATTDSTEFKEIARFFKREDFQSFSRKCAHFLQQALLSPQSDDRRYNSALGAASENLASLIAAVNAQTKEQFTSAILDAYSDGAQDRITCLYLKGDVPPFDFRNKKISKSRFRSYTRFLESDFSESKFSHCSFENCHNPSIKSSSFLTAELDPQSCNLGDLSDSTAMLDAEAAKDEVLLRREVTRFLSAFYKGANFRELRTSHIKFSIHIDALSSTNLSRVCSKNYIFKKASKEIDDFFAISPSFQGSVRRLLNDGYIDGQMKGFFDFARGT